MPDPGAAMGAPGEVTANGSRQAVDILVVDDSPVKLLALETALTPLGENVIAVSSGREALRQLLMREFATIVLDVNMPDIDGFETARMIRSRPRTAATPIIFVSAVNMDEVDAYRGYALGAVDYIFAPVVPEVLRAKVSVFVELHRKSEEARIHAERLKERTLELERSQRELRLSERMASIGTLCAGLGHDMGNLLLPISVWVHTMRSMELAPGLEDGVQRLDACVQYLRKLASGLRLVSLDPGRDSGDERVVLRAWLEDVEPILRSALPRGITLTFDVAADLPAVRIAAHRLAQVAFNLIQNAGEVMRGRPDSQVRLWAEREGSGAGVRIGVSDNGPGMSPEVQQHCLDPFFTTKKRGISTGLGLSLVHGIIQSAHAQLDISSSPERGTTFSFVLPPAEELKREKTVAIVTINDPRRRGLALSLLRAAGCEAVDELPERHAGAAIWVTEAIDDLPRRAEEFAAGHADRRVFLIGEGAPEAAAPHVCTSSLTGAPGLIGNIRCFLNGRRAAVAAP